MTSAILHRAAQASSAAELGDLKAAHRAEVQRLEEAALKDAERAAGEVREQMGAKLEAAAGKVAQAERRIQSLRHDLEVPLTHHPPPPSHPTLEGGALGSY